jgi:hypothetical protein
MLFTAWIDTTNARSLVLEKATPKMTPALAAREAHRGSAVARCTARSACGEDSRKRTASLNELRLQKDTKEQRFDEHDKEDHHDAQLDKL